MKLLILFFKIVFFIVFFYNNYAFSADTTALISALKKKVESINTLYTEIETTGYDQDNNKVNLDVFYWKNKNNIKKIIVDGADTVTTLINNDTYFIHYQTSNMLIVGNLKNLAPEELKQFQMQNYILDFYKINDLLNDYYIYELIVLKNEKIIKLRGLKTKEDIEIIFDNKTLDLKHIKIIINKDEHKNQKLFEIKFRIFKINSKISEKIFDNKIFNTPNFSGAEFD